MDHDNDPELPEPPSKSARKRAMTALQELGEELVALSPDQLARIPLPDPLLEAVQAARRVNKFGALRRQMQYIGKLMREIDPEPVQAALDGVRQTSGAAVARLHQLERWRERLLAADDALAELVREHPGCDRQHLASLVRAARRELAEGRPPRNRRALFQALKALLAPDADDSADPEGGLYSGPSDDGASA